jgi:hypothetical protein
VDLQQLQIFIAADGMQLKMCYSEVNGQSLAVDFPSRCQVDTLAASGQLKVELITNLPQDPRVYEGSAYIQNGISARAASPWPYRYRPSQIRRRIARRAFRLTPWVPQDSQTSGLGAGHRSRRRTLPSHYISQRAPTAWCRSRSSPVERTGSAGAGSPDIGNWYKPRNST